MFLTTKTKSFGKLFKRTFFLYKKGHGCFFIKIGCAIYDYLNIWWICFVFFLMMLKNIVFDKLNVQYVIAIEGLKKIKK